MKMKHNPRTDARVLCQLSAMHDRSRRRTRSLRRREVMIKKMTELSTFLFKISIGVRKLSYRFVAKTENNGGRRQSSLW